MSTLEHRYRRLLRLYPRAHRRLHEEEMLAVLLACATPGQQRLTMADRLDLLHGALKIRWRHLQSVFGPEWSDALAVVSLIAPLLMLACSPVPVVAVLADGGFDPRGLDDAPIRPTEILVSSYVVGWTLATLAGSLGKRWTSAATAAALAVMAVYFRLADLANGFYMDTLEPPLLLTGLIAAIALIASPGPRRGAQLIGVRGTLFSIAAAALVFVLNTGVAMVPYGYSYELPFQGLLPYLLLIPVVTGRSALQLRVAALLVPHMTGAAAHWIGMDLLAVKVHGVSAVPYEEPYYLAYAIALLSLLLLLLRARAIGVPTRSTNTPPDATGSPDTGRVSPS